MLRKHDAPATFFVVGCRPPHPTWSGNRGRGLRARPAHLHPPRPGRAVDAERIKPGAGPDPAGAGRRGRGDQQPGPPAVLVAAAPIDERAWTRSAEPGDDGYVTALNDLDTRTGARRASTRSCAASTPQNGEGRDRADARRRRRPVADRGRARDVIPTMQGKGYRSPPSPQASGCPPANQAAERARRRDGAGVVGRGRRVDRSSSRSWPGCWWWSARW